MLEGFWPQGGQEDGPVNWGKFSQFDVDVMSPSMDSEDDVLAADNPDALLSTFISSYTISDGSESGAMDVDGRNPEFVRPPSFLVCSQLLRFVRCVAPRIASSISHRWEGGGIARVLYLELVFFLCSDMAPCQRQEEHAFCKNVLSMRQSASPVNERECNCVLNV